MTSQKYYFSIPNFCYRFKLNKTLLALKDNHPEMFNDGIVIESTYDSFPHAIWNGGRVAVYGNCSAYDVNTILKFFNDRNIACRYTFTNCLLEEHHVYDTWCNFLMNSAHNGKNDVTINLEFLEKYCREKYPNFRYISSTTKCIRSIDDFNLECEKDYYLCVLHYDFNKKFDELKKIKYPEKTEIILNEYCGADCQQREAHYKHISADQLGFRTSWFGGCDYTRPTYEDIKGRPNYISFDQIVNVYAPMGINHFKIVGRGASPEVVAESYIDYFIKPEYHVTARLLLNEAYK